VTVGVGLGAVFVRVTVVVLDGAVTVLVSVRVVVLDGPVTVLVSVVGSAAVVGSGTVVVAALASAFVEALANACCAFWLSVVAAPPDPQELTAQASAAPAASATTGRANIGTAPR
jgi:hypothetical protein